MDPPPPPPTEMQAVWIRSGTDGTSALEDVKIEVEADPTSSYSIKPMLVLMEPFLARGISI